MEQIPELIQYQWHFLGAAAVAVLGLIFVSWRNGALNLTYKDEAKTKPVYYVCPRHPD